MEAVRGINVPMYTTLRRTTVAFTMVVEYLLTGQKHSLPVVGRCKPSELSAVYWTLMENGYLLLYIVHAPWRCLSATCWTSNYSKVFQNVFLTKNTLPVFASISEKEMFLYCCHFKLIDLLCYKTDAKEMVLIVCINCKYMLGIFQTLDVKSYII